MSVPSCSPQEDGLEMLARVVRRERAALIRVAQREGAGIEDAVECVQDALCTFLGMQQRGEVPAEVGEWGFLLAGVVRNAARNRRRRHAIARPHEDIDAAVDRTDAPDVDEVVIRAEEHVRLRACVAELCEVQRAVVTLRLLDEQPGEDVAHALGISRGYVDVLTHRAKAALRACMLRTDLEAAAG
ncbi:MAG: sigma-70 family RNA polymerase sigma factor [Minicystis sp.]